MGQDSSQSSLEWRSKEDGEWFSKITKESGVMIVGATTYKTFRVKRAPPGRRLIVYTNHPETIAGEGVETTSENPKALVARLERDGFTTVTVIGGAMINKLFLDSGVVDELYLTVEPILFGAGVPLFDGSVQAQLTLLGQRMLNDNTVLLHYAVPR